MFNTKVQHARILTTEPTYCDVGSRIHKPFHLWFPDALQCGPGWWVHFEVMISRYERDKYHIVAYNSTLGRFSFCIISHQQFHLVLLAIRSQIEERTIPYICEWNQMDADRIPFP